MFNKPATGSYSESMVAVILCRIPVTCDEHLVQGWDAIHAALRASEADDRAKVAANLAFAKNRLAHAVEAAQRAKPRKRTALQTECRELERAIADAVRFF